jgi:hypothetical protein
MFVNKDYCQKCGEALEVSVDTSEGVPSQAHVECDHCGAINHFSLSWEPRIWITGELGFELPAVSNLTMREADLSKAVGPVSHITDEDIEAINLL